MKIVYHAAHSTDAHLIRQLLEQEGMTAFVNGTLLEGGAGELPMGGLVTVSVADEHEARAREVIRDWERLPVPTDEDLTDEALDHGGAADEAPAASPAPPRSSGRASMLMPALVGAAIGAVLTWGVMRLSVQTLDVDLDGDEVPEEHLVYDGDRVVRVDTDRNRDGNIDQVAHYDKYGRSTKSDQDDDFDGRMEATTLFNGDLWRTVLIDHNGDGEPEYRADAEHGVIASEEWRDAKQNVVKRVRYEQGRPVSGAFDSDGDGKLDTQRRYDTRGEILSAAPIAP